MAVHCEGDCRAMVQLGEKQDFEAELSRLGFAHEAFMLYVRRASAPSANEYWSANYAVCVTNTVTRRQNIYWGGPGRRWVSDFAAEVGSGLYGAPEISRAAVVSPGTFTRPRLVSGGAKRS
jgi:hypothetical protein